MGKLQFMNQDGDWESFPTEDEIHRSKEVQALRAVVELHRPKSSHPDGWHEEIHCAQRDDQFHYPCPTIQAIEKELDNDTR
jgi:hypothetical protein